MTEDKNRSFSAFLYIQKKLLRSTVYIFIALIIFVLIIVTMMNAEPEFKNKNWVQIMKDKNNIILQWIFLLFNLCLTISVSSFWITNMVYSVRGIVRAALIKNEIKYKLIFVFFCFLNIFLPIFIFPIINICLCKRKVKNYQIYNRY